MNPDLPLAHNLYAYLEVDFVRATEAMLRLLKLVRRYRADPEIFSGLVHACSYCGLLDASIAAYEKAHRIDPNVETSVSHSYWYAGDVERAVATDNPDSPFMIVLAQLRDGQNDQVVTALQELASRGQRRIRKRVGSSSGRAHRRP